MKDMKESGSLKDGLCCREKFSSDPGKNNMGNNEKNGMPNPAKKETVKTEAGTFTIKC